LLITPAYQVSRSEGAYGTAMVASSRAGHVSSRASALSASASESANTGDAMTIDGVSMPAPGTARDATICSSTRRSTSALIVRAHG